jgi:xanthosine utilization system XapX-like protein
VLVLLGILLRGQQWIPFMEALIVSKPVTAIIKADCISGWKSML